MTDLNYQEQIDNLRNKVDALVNLANSLKVAQDYREIMGYFSTFEERDHAESLDRLASVLRAKCRDLGLEV